MIFVLFFYILQNNIRIRIVQLITTKPNVVDIIDFIHILYGWNIVILVDIKVTERIKTYLLNYRALQPPLFTYVASSEPVLQSYAKLQNFSAGRHLLSLQALLPLVQGEAVETGEVTLPCGLSTPPCTQPGVNVVSSIATTPECGKVPTVASRITWEQKKAVN